MTAIAAAVGLLAGPYDYAVYVSSFVPKLTSMDKICRIYRQLSNPSNKHIGTFVQNRTDIVRRVHIKTNTPRPPPSRVKWPLQNSNAFLNKKGKLGSRQCE